jgi:hypothetical protein
VGVDLELDQLTVLCQTGDHALHLFKSGVFFDDRTEPVLVKKGLEHLLLSVGGVLGVEDLVGFSVGLGHLQAVEGGGEGGKGLVSDLV